MEITLKVEGMNCQHCVGKVQQALEDLDNITHAAPDLASGTVRIDGEDLDVRQINQTLIDAGYKAAE